MKKYDIAHSELTNCYYIMCDGEKVAECTEQIANIRADAFDRGYDKGRADKYREITSEYMLLTEKQVEEIRADAIDECIEALGNNIWDIAKLEQLKEQKDEEV